MKKWPIFLLLLTAPPAINAQDCSCSQGLAFLKQTIENNYAGYTDKVKPANRVGYTAFCADLSGKAKKTNNRLYCLGLLNEYLGYFRDGHIVLSNNDTVAYKPKAEIYPVSTKKLAALKTTKGIEGIYHDPDGVYSIALVKSKTNYRDYAGVILSSETSSWAPGMVKLELRQISPIKFVGYNYVRDHTMQEASFFFDGNGFRSIDGAWLKEGDSLNKANEPDDVAVEAKKLDNSTLYIRIGTFEDDNAAAVDSVFKANKENLRTMPYLILDVRGNSGGSDFVFDPLLPLLYTSPVRQIGQDVRATTGNIKGWQYILTLPGLPADLLADIRTTIASMQAHIGQYIPASGDTVLTGTKLNYPQKIVILTDDQCASSTEELLLIARQSKKVVLMGQHSAGTLDYSNMRPADFPCLPFTIWWATTRSRRIDQGAAIDNVGISPDILLNASQNWITAALQFLEK